MRDPYQVLVKPMVSEKSMLMMEDNKYSFVVDKNANKIEIKHAVEAAFKVKVVNVTTRNIKGKIRRMGRTQGKRPDTKRAIVTLAEGNKIEIFANL
ncbi:MAG: 50S ribosomal protein L23 [Firmicutes bacterium]|nr:50S ribosomal protein L23 [Bacillota bacterium]MBR6824740.1 50S ribosomal protein L23 [Bacillota bacterium]